MLRISSMVGAAASKHSSRLFSYMQRINYVISSGKAFILFRVWIFNSIIGLYILSDFNIYILISRWILFFVLVLKFEFSGWNAQENPLQKFPTCQRHFLGCLFWQLVLSEQTPIFKNHWLFSVSKFTLDLFSTISTIIELTPYILLCLDSF